MLTASSRLATASKQTLGEGVAERLREEIISGSLPPGATVAEIPTAERLGVSRVPVREARRCRSWSGMGCWYLTSAGAVACAA